MKYISYNTNPVIDVSLKCLKQHSLDLALKVENFGFSPNYIIYIERAGLFAGYEMAKYFNCNISGLRASRKGSSAKMRIRYLLMALPRIVTHFLRKIEILSNFHNVNKDRNVTFDGPFPGRNTNILIVDDAIDTGNSMKAAVNHLVSLGYKKENIKTAVLTTTTKLPVYKPDISLFEQVTLAFPWSYDSREFDKAWNQYDLIKKEI